MKVLAPKVDGIAIAAAFDDPSQLVVVSLCAAWCDTCNEFRQGYERLATARPAIAFVWLDIEDDAEIAGDIDVENFPTLAVFRGADPLHYGVSLPQESVIRHLVDALDDRGEPSDGIADAVAALPARFIRDG